LELLEEVARGGMGVVYRARQISLNRIVAVKMLLSGRHAKPEFVVRFRREAEAAARLQHPNIVSIHEIGEFDGQPYFSMDYVSGRSLADVVREHALPAGRAARYVRTIATAIHYAHQRGVLHRDLKPGNVLIDEADQPRITDFGLAKQFQGEPESSTTESILGSPGYMPPEQADPSRGRATVRSDVYSLGAILYHLITGCPPFKAESLEATLRLLLHEEPPAPRALNPSIPRDLETICLKCLEKRGDRRYASGLDLAEDLGCFLRGETIRARPAGAAERIWRWSRRQPALAALAVLLVVISAGSTWTAIHLRRLNEAARRSFYIADMNLALRDFEQGNVAQAQERLNRQIPARGETDLRGFEWRYLWRQCGGGSASLPRAGPGHTQIVGTLQFSPDDRQMAAFAWNHSLKVYDLGNLKEAYTMAHVTGFGGYASGSGSLIVTSNGDTTLVLNGESGIAQATTNTAGEIAAWAPEAQWMATITTNGELYVSDLNSQAILFHLPHVTVHRFDIGYSYPVALSPNGHLLAIIERDARPEQPDRRIRLWSLPDGQEQEAIPLDSRSRCIAFSGDGNLLATGDGKGRAHVWSVGGPHRILLSFKAHDFQVLALAFSPDDRTLATGSSDRAKIRLWDLSTGELRQHIFAGQLDDVWSLAFSHDGKRLASGSRKAPIQIWNLELEPTGEILESDLATHGYANFVFSPDGRWMAAGCSNNTVKVWETAFLRTPPRVLRDATYVVAFSEDSQSVLVSTSGGVPRWRKVDGSGQADVPRYGGPLDDIACVALPSDRQTAAIGLTNGTIEYRDIQSGQLAGPILRGHVGPVYSLAYDPKGRFLASGGADKWLKLWDRKTGALLGASEEHKGSICALAISPNGEFIASGCGAETIKLWRASHVADGSEFSITPHKSVIRTLAFSPDGRNLASGSEDDTVKIWRLDLDRARLEMHEVASFKHESHIRLVAFSPDGNTLATVTDLGWLRIFQAAGLEAAATVVAAR